MDGYDDREDVSSSEEEEDSPIIRKNVTKNIVDDDEEDEEDNDDQPETITKSNKNIDDNDEEEDDDDEDDDDEEDDPFSQQRRNINLQPQHHIEDDEIEEEENEAPAPPPPRHECEMPSTCPNLGTKLFYVKLPNFLSIDTREYDPQFYEDEIDDDEQLDNEGRARMKLKVENTIRWRRLKDSDGNEVTQSNARVVEWSDGTKSLYLGSEIFDVNEKSMGECSHLFIRQGIRQGLQGQAIFTSKLSIRPNSTESFTHRKLTLSLADRSQKTQKIRMLNNPGQDPEARLNELSKKEDDKMKATLRRETKQRRIQERSQTRGPSASYLEPDFDEEDEDGGISLSAIKRTAMSRPYANDSDESSDAEDNDYSDDSDPEFGKIQVKKSASKKVKQVVEDDSDED